MTIHTEINPLGHRTAYLWEQVWERTSWLEIIGRYVIAKKNKKKQIESYIFPRYHQLDVTRKLQDAVYGFERTVGVVATIKGDGGSKSSELAEALSGDKKIIVCTIQTFPALQKKMLELTTQGKRFAVIADEAHSSQSGEAAKKLKSVLSVEEQNELEDGGEVSTEDILAAEMSTRASVSGITYVAFTATPKAKSVLERDQ